MIANGTVGKITNKIFDAEKMVIKGLRDKFIETEPSLTDRFLGAVENAFGENGFEFQGYRIRARTLRDRGRNAPEHEFGADFVSVLDINMSTYSISKGFLVQAKLAGKEDFQIVGEGNYPLQIRFPSHSTGSKPRLWTQCEQMLNITPDSFVFVYSEIGIYVVPATTIVSITTDGRAQKIHAKTLKQFYKDHLSSFVGDKELNAFDDNTLRARRDITFANHGLLIQMREEKEIKKPSRFSSIDV